jgi:hypothetical protein
VHRSQEGKVALGVPQTDVEDVRRLARFDHRVGFDDEVGMIHSVAHHFEHFGIRQGTIGLEYTFLTQSMMGMIIREKRHRLPKIFYKGEISAAFTLCLKRDIAAGFSLREPEIVNIFNDILT